MTIRASIPGLLFVGGGFLAWLGILAFPPGPAGFRGVVSGGEFIDTAHGHVRVSSAMWWWHWADTRLIAVGLLAAAAGVAVLISARMFGWELRDSPSRRGRLDQAFVYLGAGWGFLCVLIMLRLLATVAWALLGWMLG